MPDSAFENLVLRYSKMVLNTATHFLGRAEAAQDVHQEVFLAIWQHWTTFEPPVHWPGYLYRATVSKAIDRIRSEQNWPDSPDGLEQTAADHPPEPSHQLNVLELKERLRWCVARLPERQAQVFVMSRLEGLSPADIARHLDCSQETIRVHLHRALRSLTDLMREYLAEGID